MKKIMLLIVICMLISNFVYAMNDSLITFDDTICDSVTVDYKLGGQLPPDSLVATIIEYHYETNDKNEIKQIIDCINRFTQNTTTYSGESADGEYLNINFHMKNKNVVEISFDVLGEFWEYDGQHFLFVAEEYNILNELINNFRTKNDILIYFDNNLLKSYTSPMLINDRTLIPAITLKDALGTDMKWNREDHSIVFGKNNDTLVLFLDENYMMANGEMIELDVGGKYENNHGMVPLRAICEFFGYAVEWENNAVYIWSE